jgi:hypothetical protein
MTILPFYAHRIKKIEIGFPPAWVCDQSALASSSSAAPPAPVSPSPTPPSRPWPAAAATRRRGHRPPRPERRGKLGRGCADALHALPPIRAPPLTPHTHRFHTLPPLFPRALRSARRPLLEFAMESVNAVVLGRLRPELVTPRVTKTLIKVINK